MSHKTRLVILERWVHVYMLGRRFSRFVLYGCFHTVTDSTPLNDFNRQNVRHVVTMDFTTRNSVLVFSLKRYIQGVSFISFCILSHIHFLFAMSIRIDLYVMRQTVNSDVYLQEQQCVTCRTKRSNAVPDVFLIYTDLKMQ